MYFKLNFKKKLIFKLLIFFSIFLTTNNFVLAEEKVNAGIVNGLWYSKVPFFAEEQIRIYTAIQNQSGFSIKGTIQFLDGDNLIGESDFSASDSSFIKEYTDWKVTHGYHYISIKIVNVEKTEKNEEFEPIFLDTDFLEVDEQFADFDTDGDRIGDMGDLDIDNAGLSNEQELEIGAYPLIIDTDNDGISHGKDI